MAKQLNEGREEKAETKTTETTEITKTTAKFTKKQLISCKRYRDRQDILNALLADGREYTHSEAEKMIEDFLKGEVK